MIKKYLFPLIIISLLISGFIGSFFINIETVDMTYNSFLNEVEQNNIKSVTLDESSHHFKVDLYDDTVNTYLVTNPKTENFTEYLLLHNIDIQYDTSKEIANTVQTFMIISIIVFVFIYIRKNDGSKRRISDSNKKNGSKTSTTFNQVAGNVEAKAMVKDIIHFIKQPEKYTDLGAKMPRGILLYGPPGTGKTLMAKAIAGEADVPFFAMSGSDFVQMYVGVGASRIRSLFQKAKKNEKAVIFIDEIDSIGKKRGKSASASNDERDQTLNALLTEMSGFHENDGIIVIAATNRLDTLDEALLRPGRFDRQIEIGLPDVNSRKKILTLHAKNKPLSDDVDIEQLSKSTVYFSGAMLENLLNEAAIFTANDNQSFITSKHIDQAFYTVLAGAQKQDRSYISEQDRKVTAYHEAGHALVTKLLLPDQYISKVTIIPSVRGAGGFNLSIPKDTLYQTKKQIESNLQVLLAGRVAEELTFGKDYITTGAGNDIQKASSLLLDYINKFGMNNEYGLFSIDTSGGQQDPKLVEKCRLQMNDLYEKTRVLIQENRSFLDNIAESLLEKESLDEKDIMNICA